MRLTPIRNPKCVHLALKGISAETAAFADNLAQLTSKLGRREDAEELIYLARAGLTTWRDQLNNILKYVAQDLKPE